MMIYLFLLYRDEIISTELIDEILNTHSELSKNKLKDIIRKTNDGKIPDDKTKIKIKRWKKGY